MKIGVNQLQKQKLVLTTKLQNQIKLLSASGEEIRNQLDKLINQFFANEKNQKDFDYFRDVILTDRYNYFFNSTDTNFSGNFKENESEDLRKILWNQMSLLNLKEHEYLIGEYLIDSIEEDGRLNIETDFGDIRSLILEEFNLKVKERDIEKILSKIQHLDPVGCGYRNLTESLLIQTDYLEVSESEKCKIKNSLRNIGEGKLEIQMLSKKEKALIRQLKFNPSFGTGSLNQNYIRPDLLAFKTQKDWKISLNDSFMSKALLDKVTHAVKNSSKESKQDAKSFLNGLERRQKTLYLVADFLVERQKKFLDGEGNLVPISLKQIATFINVSESTISRVVSSKYIQFPTKTIPLKNLLEKSVNSRSEINERVSPPQLKQLISKLITEEDKTSPLSDEQIKEVLRERYSVNIARRTVNKYRQEAKITSTRYRISI